MSIPQSQMTLQEALNIVSQATRAYRGTADDHEMITKALFLIQEFIRHSEEVQKRNESAAALEAARDHLENLRRDAQVTS